MRVTHHVIERADFTNTTWTSTYVGDTKSWFVITAKMRGDTAMCDTETIGGVSYPRVLDKNVIAFVMRGNNTGCWARRATVTGTTLKVR